MAKLPELAALFDSVADDYESTGTDYFRPMARRLVQLAGIGSGAVVLDVGTGRGAVLMEAAKAVGPHGVVLGLDVSGRMVALTTELAKRATNGGGANVAVLVADASRPPTAGPVHGVLGGMVAQFLDSPLEALARWAAITIPGGRLALSWWAGDDDRFSGLNSVVAQHLNIVQTKRTRPFAGDVLATESLIQSQGWADVKTVVEPQAVIFEDLDAWWRWSWSHAQRRKWQSVEDFTALKRDVDAELESLLDADGRLRYRPRAAFTTASRSATQP